MQFAILMPKNEKNIFLESLSKILLRNNKNSTRDFPFLERLDLYELAYEKSAIGKMGNTQVPVILWFYDKRKS